MTLLDLCRKAIGHVLDRAQTDPDFRYYMLHTESLALLIEAEAQLRGETIEETRWRRKDDHQPAHRWREPEIVVLRRRIEQLERALEAARVPLPEEPS